MIVGSGVTSRLFGWSQVSGLAAPAGWVHRVGFNHANAYFRRRRAERRALQRRGAGAEAVYDLPDSAAAIVLRTALVRMPRRQRAVLALRYFAGLDVAATAQALGISLEAVRSLTHRAVVALRTHTPELAAVEYGEVAGAC